MLNIETGHKTFELKANSSCELSQWHLRLQEVRLQEEFFLLGESMKSASFKMACSTAWRR